MKRLLPSLLYLTGAVAVVLGTIFPLWRVLLYFPQYPEGPLQVVAFAGALRGDLSEIEILNHYIGVAMPTNIPELQIMPPLLYGVAGLAVVAALVRSRPGLWLKGATMGFMAGSGVWAMYRINKYLTDFGSNPDPGAPLAGLMEPFKPPLIGKAVIVQVEAAAGFLWGTWFLAAAALLFLAGFIISRKHLKEVSSHE
ncbi:MAG TPA: hypothetical protein VD902_21590 [Symbiobacteriaceae bacterium]|nr:hypothetical protein [Symbiobacteriaceae bacterium]